MIFVVGPLRRGSRPRIRQSLHTTKDSKEHNEIQEDTLEVSLFPILMVDSASSKRVESSSTPTPRTNHFDAGARLSRGALTHLGARQLLGDHPRTAATVGDDPRRYDRKLPFDGLVPHNSGLATSDGTPRRRG